MHNSLALTNFQKSLEQYYAAQPEEFRLYHERRSQQYRASVGIEKIKIVTVSSQIRSFSSMFLDESHRAGRYYGTLLTSVKNKIFLNSHKPVAYYTNAYANYKLDSMLRRKQIDEKYRPFKYHILMALRLQVAGKDMPDMSANRFDKYCKDVQETLWDSTKALQSFENICNLMDQVLGGNYSRDNAKSSRLITDMINAV